jgi:hypothetical protein
VPTFNLKRFARPDGLSCIETAHLLRLLVPFADYFARRGLVLPTAVGAGQLDLKELLGILVSPDGDTPQSLIDALYFIHEMSTPRGMDMLLSEVDVEGCKASWLGEFHPADIAVKAWLDDPEMLQRRHAELHMRDFRSFHYYRTWRRPIPVFHAPSVEELGLMAERLDEAFARKNRGRCAKVFAYPQPDQSVWYLVRHGNTYRREGAINQGEPESICYRPLQFDVAIYDPTSGELRVHAEQKWEITLYRLEFGMCLFGDMTFFSNTPKYTLEPLRVRGPASLQCAGIAGMKSVTLKEVQLLWGGLQKEVQIHRAMDVFQALKLRHTQMPEQPSLVQATFAVHFTGTNEPRLVKVKPPNTALYAREEDAQLVDQWLALQGFVRTPESESMRHDDTGQTFLASA